MANDIIDRRMPFSLEAEQGVIGSVLINPDCFDDIAEVVTSDDFYMEEHRQMFYAMRGMYATSRTIDEITLIDELVKSGVYKDNQTLTTYIKTVLQSVPSAANVADYARIVHDKSILRQLISACDEISETAFSEKDDVKNVLDRAEQKIFDIAQGNEKKGFAHIRDVIKLTHNHLTLLASDSEEVKGTPTGYSAVDSKLVGIGKSDLVLIGARPGMGKTSFALNIASNVAKSTGKTVCIFSLEMSKEELVSRMLSSEGMVDSSNIRSGKLSSDEWKNIAHAADELSQCEILIDDKTGITVTGMKAKLRRVKNLGLIIIDYLQLMQSDRKIDNRVNEVGDISRNMKIMAKELGAPVLCCAQLSRGPESRTDKRPMLSDLRDSGAIEQDADVVLFLYRDEYYKTEQDGKSIAEVIVAKNRHGSTGKVDVGWSPQYTKFISLDNREENA